MDPDRKQLESALADFPYLSEADDFDREGAIYWLASDYHGGQSSALYSVLSLSKFRPGPSVNGPETEMEQMLYTHLQERFFPGNA